MPPLGDLKGLGWVILDAFRPRVHFGGSQRENKVAYLDGLRGFAAFIVYWTHYTGFCHDGIWIFRMAWGMNGFYNFAQFPFVRLFFHGGAFAVALFFIISGYVLSVSPLSQLQSGDDPMRLAKQLGCSFPRRWVRLYLPVIGTIVAFFTIWHIFGIDSGAPGHQPRRASYFLEWMRFLREFVRGSYVFNRGPGWGAGNYNTTMWSIAAEFRGSMIIYSVLFAFFALDYNPTQRFWALVVLFVYFLYVVDGTFFALFIMGILLCDIDLVSANDPFHLPKIVSRFNFMSKHRWLYYFPLILGLYMCSAPHVERVSDLRQQPGWAPFTLLVPPTAMNARWFLSAWGATLTAIGIGRIPWLKRIFETPVCQYLGKISFGFYLVHGPCIWTIGDYLIAMVGRPRLSAHDRIPGWINVFPIPNWGPLGLEMNALAPQLILLPCTLYFAGVVTKLFDEPSVKLSKWMFSPPSKKQFPSSEMHMAANSRAESGVPMLSA